MSVGTETGGMQIKRYPRRSLGGHAREQGTLVVVGDVEFRFDVRPPITAVRDAVARALTEDLTPLGDITSAVIHQDQLGRANFVARERGVLAGTDCVHETYAQLDPSVVVEWHAVDGDAIDEQQVLGVVTGPLRPILTGERTALNFLCHLSGIATMTNRFVTAAAGGARVWDTRKTIPGLRSLEKAAVRAGGGANHRGNLSDWVLLKDNHLAAEPDVIGRARQLWPGRTIHVECDSLDQVVRALDAGADALLLDNMEPDEVRTCVAMIDERTVGTRRPLIEASGGITLENAGVYATTGVDLLSTGSITMSAPALDIGLDLDVESRDGSR
jgi:nicotinate-nucleotide pyrophosphorylase (carboxylating)